MISAVVLFDLDLKQVAVHESIEASTGEDTESVIAS